MKTTPHAMTWRLHRTAPGLPPAAMCKKLESVGWLLDAHCATRVFGREVCQNKNRQSSARGIALYSSFYPLCKPHLLLVKIAPVHAWDIPYWLHRYTFGNSPGNSYLFTPASDSDLKKLPLPIDVDASELSLMLMLSLIHEHCYTIK